jgi:hypothetical protein
VTGIPVSVLPPDERTEEARPFVAGLSSCPAMLGRGRAAHPAEVSMAYRFEAEVGGCRLPGGAEGGLSGPLWRLVEPLSVRVMVRQTRADLRRLKVVLESGTDGEL